MKQVPAPRLSRGLKPLFMVSTLVLVLVVACLGQAEGRGADRVLSKKQNENDSSHEGESAVHDETEKALSKGKKGKVEKVGKTKVVEAAVKSKKKLKGEKPVATEGESIPTIVVENVSGASDTEPEPEPKPVPVPEPTTKVEEDLTPLTPADTDSTGECPPVQSEGTLRINPFQLSTILSKLKTPKKCKGLGFSEFHWCFADFGKENGCCSTSCAYFLAEISDGCWDDIGALLCSLRSNQATLMLDLLAKRCNPSKRPFMCMQSCEERKEKPKSKLTITDSEFAKAVANPKGCGKFKVEMFEKCIPDFREETGCCSAECHDVFEEVSDDCWEGIRERLCTSNSLKSAHLMDLLSRRCDHRRRSLTCMACEVDGSCQTVDNALELAAEEGNLPVVKKLLNDGAHIDAHSTFLEWTSLMYAANEGHLKVVKALLAAGADVDAHSNSGETALMLAAENGLTAVARALIKGGANVDAQDYGGFTALHTAGIENQLKMVKLLLAAGADVDLSTAKGDTPLGLATAVGNKKVVVALVNAGAET